MLSFYFAIFLVNYYRNKIYYKYHCDIHPLCILGNNLSFRHPIGIVIGSGTEIKDNVTILQHVTLGGAKFDEMGFGIPYKQIIGNNCIIGAGAKILGDLTIGDNCVIGANAVITKDIPDNCTVVGFNKIVHR
ncbi:serine acetyltransferase [Glaesserella parasuis]|nr:serine acetyltransferase [Glaesserella parasuis]